MSRESFEIIAGGMGGLLGRELAARLVSDNHRVRRLVRPGSNSRAKNTVPWQPRIGQLDPQALNGADVVICLNGANIAGHRWTDDYKRELRESRMVPTRLLAKTIAGLERKPKCFLAASAVGIYGNRGNEILDESSTLGDGFLADLTREWEAATQEAVDAGIRVVNLRIGIVLSPKGGALKKMKTAFKLGLGGTIGSGKQYMSWIAIEDVIEAIVYCMRHEEMVGPINLSAPNPVINSEFTRALGQAVHRPTILPVPGFATRMMFGEMGESLLLGGNRVLPAMLMKAGFRFCFPNLPGALGFQLNKS